MNRPEQAERKNEGNGATRHETEQRYMRRMSVCTLLHRTRFLTTTCTFQAAIRRSKRKGLLLTKGSSQSGTVTYMRSVVRCTMNLADLVQLWRVSRRRLRSRQDYERFQAFQATLLLKYFRDHDLYVTGRRVLDLGSGVGGYSRQLAKCGAAVVSLDLISSPELTDGHRAIVGNALQIPLHDRSIDFVLCASLIEHVADPSRLLEEIRRVLKGEGYCYLSFPPFFGPLGGHQFSPFHYLGEDWALRLKGRRMKTPQWVSNLYHVSPAPRSFSETYGDWGLFKMTVAKARRLVRASDFRVIDISARYLPVSFIRWPVLGEILTWHAQFLLRKPS